jgi:hypothetical protein
MLALLAPLTLTTGCRKSSEPEPEASSEPEFSVTSEALAREYETDSAAADRKYKGKWVLVEGPMEDIDLLEGDLCVSLKKVAPDPTKKPRGRVIRGYFLPTDAKKLSGLTRGQEIQFKGKCDGEQAGGFVDFLSCELAVVGPDPSLPVTAAKLTRDYGRDEKAADATYKDRYVLVEGTVVGLQEKDGIPAVLLEGHDEKSPAPLRVSATYSPRRKDEFAALKKGNKVKVKGECAGRFLGEVSVRYAELVP